MPNKNEKPNYPVGFLIICDIFSRRIYATLIYTKKSIAIQHCLDEIWQQAKTTPDILETDQVKFINECEGDRAHVYIFFFLIS